MSSGVNESLRRVRLAADGVFLAIEGLREETLASIIESHRANRDPERLLKRNLGTVVTRVQLARECASTGAAGLPRELVVKEVPVRPRRRIFYLLGGSSSFRKEFEVVRRLHEVGVKAPRTIACSLRPRGASEILITEFIDGCVPLRDLLWLGDHVIRDRGELAALFASVGAWLRSIHDLGVWQRDLKPSNVLVRRDGRPWKEAELILVDLAAVRVLGRPVDEPRRVRNLAQLLDLTADLDGPVREPLLRAYLGDGAPDLDRWSSMVHAAIEARRDYRERQCGCRHVDAEHQKHHGPRN